MYIKNTALFYAPIPTYSTDNITMEVWIKPERDDEHSFPLYLGSYFAGYGFHLHNGVNDGAGNFASLKISSASYSITGNPVRLHLNTWTHLAITHNSNGWKFYRNGEHIGNGEFIAKVDSTCKYQTAFFTGTIDEVRFWNITRTQAEIKRSFQKALTGNEKGLISYYNFNSFELNFGSVIVNNTQDTSKNAILYGDVNNAAIVEGAPISDEEYPIITFNEKPSHYQFFPRNSNNSAPIHISGAVKTPGWNMVVCERYSNDSLTERINYPLIYNHGIATFEFSSRITSTPILFTYRIFILNGTEKFLIGESADLSCGDVYIIAGQSNSHPAADSSIYINPLLKTLGILTPNGNLDKYNPSDTLWGMANGHGFNYFFSAYTGPYLTSVWGIEIQRLILEKYGIPTCIINAGAGSSSVYMNQRDDNTPMNLNTIYGRGLYRTSSAKLTSAVKAIFWLQGEGESAEGYANAFDELYKDWKEDYPNTKVTYVFQLRPGCPGAPHLELRELQRNIPKFYSDIKTIATVGLNGFDGCHYHYSGYIDLAEKVFWQMERDFYGRKDTANITPPNVDRVFYSTSAKDEIKVIFKQKNDEFIYPNKLFYSGKIRSLDDYFYLDGVSGNIAFGMFDKDTLILTLRQPSTAQKITYLPENFYNNETEVYQGPWITNKAGIGALSFYDVPINNNSDSFFNKPISEKMVFYAEKVDALKVFVSSSISEEIYLTFYNLIGQVIDEQKVSYLPIGVNLLPLPSGGTNQLNFVRVVCKNDVFTIPFMR